MDLDRGLLEMIDEYVSNALAATGTRRAPRPSQAHRAVPPPEPEASDLEPQTEPFAARYEAEPGTFVIDEHNADAVLLAQVKQQLVASQSAVERLPRSRAPRSTADLDDELTTVAAKPRR